MSARKAINSAVFMAMFAGLLVSAQSKKGPASWDVETQEIVTQYYGQEMGLKELEAYGNVSTVRLPNENGEMVYFSFDTEEEALTTFEEKTGVSRSTFKYCICYKDSNYGGSSILFTGKDYNDLDEAGWNDKISSFKCTSNTYMVFYEHDNYTGSTYDTQGWNITQHSNIHTLGWGDKITSIWFRF